jgi:hypothetical protein
VKGVDAFLAFSFVGWELTLIKFRPPEEAATMTPAEHPDCESLVRFILGRLDRRAMARVEGHLRGCTQCWQVAMQVPDDRLVRLLRVPTSGPAIDRLPATW